MRASARNRRSFHALSARAHLAALLMLVPLAACSAAGDKTNTTPSGDGSTGDDSGGFNPFDAPQFEVGDSNAPVVATLTGVVKAPEGTIPISGALVYLVGSPPDPIPTGVYCDECVKLESGTPFTLSKPDGSFSLGVTNLGSQFLVVQKGQFRRIRQINVTAGAVSVPVASTTMPKKTDDAAGDTIPHMALVNGAWDAIDMSLAGMGLGTVTNSGPLGTKQVDKKTAPYDYYYGAPAFSPGSKGDYTKILNDYSVLSQYHIVFLPCSWSDQTTCNVSQPSATPAVQANLQRFVKAGGKLYATDYSYEFVRQVFPGYVKWKEQTSTVGSACLKGAWDGAASSPDKGLTEWLAAQSITSFTVQQNWTALDSVAPQMTTDAKGAPLLETPKIWVNAAAGGYGTIPTTVSFQQACGRVLYSTYHTEGSSAGLLPQERALLYILLEVGVCIGQVGIK
jgi:hypothetical protein